MSIGEMLLVIMYENIVLNDLLIVLELNAYRGAYKFVLYGKETIILEPL
jgi:hypothetical protein